MLLPATGTGSLEGLDDISQAPQHGFLYFDDTEEMVGHADACMHYDLVAMGL